MAHFYGPEARPAPRGALIGGSRFASRRRPGPFALSLAGRPGGGGAAGGGAAGAGRGGTSRGARGTGGGSRAVPWTRVGSLGASRGEQVGLLRLLRMNGIPQETGVWSWNLGGGCAV